MAKNEEMMIGMMPNGLNSEERCAYEVGWEKCEEYMKSQVDGLLEALRFYADPASYQFIHGTASYMPIEVDDGYKAKTAIQRFNGEV